MKFLLKKTLFLVLLLVSNQCFAGMSANLFKEKYVMKDNSTFTAYLLIWDTEYIDEKEN